MARLVAVLALFGSSGCACQEFRPVRGTLVDQSRNPIAGAQVSASEYYAGTVRSVASDATGTFRLTRDDVTGQGVKHGGEACPAGLLEISASGCQAKTMEFDVRGDDELDLGDVMLSCTK